MRSMYKSILLFTFANSALNALALSYANNTFPVVHDSKEVAEAFFADPDGPIYSPAFLNGYDNPDGFRDGTANPTSDESVYNFLQDIVNKNEWATYHELEAATEERRNIPYLVLSNEKDAHKEPFPSEKLKIWIQGGTHGNEPAGDQAVLAFIGLMDNDPEYASKLLKDIDFLIIPRYSVDGVKYFQRQLASNLDPNRDHIKLFSYQSQRIKCLYNKFNAHVAIDTHETRSDIEPGKKLIYAYDGLYATGKNLNLDPRIRQMSEDIFPSRIEKELEEKGLRGHPYFFERDEDANLYTELGGNAIFGSFAYSLNQAFALLTETRGLGMGDEHFKRRTQAGLSMVKSMIDAAHENSKQIQNLVQDARVNMGTPSSMLTDIALDYSQETIEKKFQVIDTSSIELKEIDINWSSGTLAKPNGTVSQPAAYIIPVAFEQVARRLRALGVHIKTMDDEWTGEVDTYNITSTSVESTYWEGTFHYTVTASPGSRKITFPKGSYVVPTNQPNAAFAFVTLEPESIASFVYYNIIPVSEGDEYPVFRIPRGANFDIKFENNEQYEIPTECTFV